MGFSAQPARARSANIDSPAIRAPLAMAFELRTRMPTRRGTGKDGSTRPPRRRGMGGATTISGPDGNKVAGGSQGQFSARVGRRDLGIWGFRDLGIWGFRDRSDGGTRPVSLSRSPSSASLLFTSKSLNPQIPKSPLPMPLFQTVTDLTRGAETLRRRPYGVIEVADGRLRARPPAPVAQDRLRPRGHSSGGNVSPQPLGRSRPRLLQPALAVPQFPGLALRGLGAADEHGDDLPGVGRAWTRSPG